MTAKLAWPIAAACITVALFLLMGHLITPSGEVPVSEVDDVTVVIKRAERDETPDQKTRNKREKPVKQATPPPPVIQKTKPVMRKNSTALNVPIPTSSGGTGKINTTMDRRATPIVRIPPQYPHSPLQRGIEGWVLVEFTITQTGTVENTKVIDADPAKVFDRAAIRAIKRWKYQPKIKNGKAVPQHNMREIFRFEIQKS